MSALTLLAHDPRRRRGSPASSTPIVAARRPAGPGHHHRPRWSIPPHRRARPGRGPSDPVGDRARTASNDIVIGASTLADAPQACRRLGDALDRQSQRRRRCTSRPPRSTSSGRRRCPRSATPASSQDHTSMGYGAMFPSRRSRGFRFHRASSDPDQNVRPGLGVRAAPAGVSPAAGRANLQRDRGPTADPGARRGPQHRRELGGRARGPAAGPDRQLPDHRVDPGRARGRAGRRGAVVALGFTLYASVRRRRRDLALLKALGFAPRQLAAAVAWQATIAAVIGVVARHPARDRRRPPALGRLRPARSTRCPTRGAGPLGGPRRRRGPGVRQPGRRRCPGASAARTSTAGLLRLGVTPRALR